MADEREDQWIQPGKSYLIRVEIPKDITEEARKEAEARILGSIFYPEKHVMIPGVITKAYYRSDIELSDVITTAQNAILEKIKEAVDQVSFKEINKGTILVGFNG